MSKDRSARRDESSDGPHRKGPEDTPLPTGVRRQVEEPLDRGRSAHRTPSESDLPAFNPPRVPPFPRPSSTSPTGLPTPRFDSTLAGQQIVTDAGVSESESWLTDFLESHPLTRRLGPQDRHLVARHLRVARFEPGDTILQAGTPANRLGFVYEGRAAVLSADATTKEEFPVRALSPPDLCGELSMLLSHAQPHTIRAQSSCVTLELHRGDLKRLVDRVPQLGVALAEWLAHQLAQLTMTAERSPTAVPRKNAPIDDAPSIPASIAFVRVEDYAPSRKTLGTLPLELVRARKVLPLLVQRQRILLGMVSPFDPGPVAEVQLLHPSAQVQTVAISREDFDATLSGLEAHSARRAGHQPVVSYRHRAPTSLANNSGTQNRNKTATAIDQLIAQALHRGASDVLIEPQGQTTVIRFREDGHLVEWNEADRDIRATELITHLKILAGADPTHRRLPQHGRIGVTIERHEFDLRLSTLPTPSGERAVLHVADRSKLLRPLDHTFVDPNTVAVIRRSLGAAAGAALIAGGPQASRLGTLYSMLFEYKKLRPNTQVIMVEDPIECRFPGATQVEVDLAHELTYPRALRAALRHRPDAIMAGEARDAETLQLTLEAALSGHLALTSLQAPNVIGALGALNRLGNDSPFLGHALSLVVAQRHAPRLCPGCVRCERPAPLMAEGLLRSGLLADTPSRPVPVPVGCASCGGTGFTGRITLTETLELDDDLRSALALRRDFVSLVPIAEERGRYLPFRTAAARMLRRNEITAADALAIAAN